MADEIIVRLRGEGVDDFIKKMKASGAEVSDLGKTTEKENKKMTKSFSGLGAAVAGALSTAAIFEFGKAITRLATDIDATNAKFKTVFGDAGRIVDDFAKKSARSLGLTTNEFRKASAAIGDLLVPLGFQRSEAAKLSSELVKLSGSLAKWDTQQRSSIQIADILSKALLGEREQLKSLGVNIQEADVKQRLFEKGQKNLEGTALQQAKALATLELITEKTGDAQAAAADDTETLREKQLQLGASVRQLAQDFAEDLTPAIGGFLDLINGYFERVSEFDRVRDVARQGTFQEVQAERERLQAIADSIRSEGERTRLTFAQRVELERLEKQVRLLIKAEEERDFRRESAGRRGGATDEQRRAIEAQRIADEALKAEQERLELQKQQEAAEKAAEQAAKRLQKTLAAGVKEIRNGVLGLKDWEGITEGITVQVDFLQSNLDKAIDAIENADLGDLYNSISAAVSDADMETEQFWEDSAKKSEDAAQREVQIQEAKYKAISEIGSSAFGFIDGLYDRQIENVRRKVEAEEITEKEGQRQIAEIKRKQAVADKLNALFEIALNTAIAVTSAVAQFPLTGGQPFAGIAIGIGAAQAAAVAAQPIPQFAKGTKGSRTAPEGFAWVGEEGPELVQMKGGEKVITAGDSEQLMKMLGGYGIPVQFKSSYEQLYKPMSAMNELAKGTPLEGIDWNPLLRSNDVGRRTSARKLDAIHDQLVRLNHGLSRRMTRA